MLTPESKKLMQRYASAISNEVITGEQDFVSVAKMKKYEAATESARIALEAHIAQLEASAPPSDGVTAPASMQAGSELPDERALFEDWFYSKYPAGTAFPFRIWEGWEARAALAAPSTHDGEGKV